MSLPTIWPESVGRSAEKLVGTETTVATWELWYENGHILLNLYQDSWWQKYGWRKNVHHFTEES